MQGNPLTGRLCFTVPSLMAIHRASNMASNRASNRASNKSTCMQCHVTEVVHGVQGVPSQTSMAIEPCMLGVVLMCRW